VHSGFVSDLLTALFGKIAVMRVPAKAIDTDEGGKRFLPGKIDW
jgi:hypothetical protein